MSFNELKLHGTEDFPFELYKLNESHPRYVMAMHWHINIELMRVLKGVLDITLDNRTYVAKEGDIFIANSETLHSAVPRKGCYYECIVFNPNFLRSGNQSCNAFIDSLLFHSAFLYERVSDDEVKRLLNDIFDCMDQKKHGYIFKVMGMMMSLFGTFMEKNLYSSPILEYRQNDKKIFKLKKVLKFIRDNFASNISLEDMSAIAELSPNYFSSFFKSLTDKSPVEYLISYRIERAAGRLLSTDDSITQIAYDCGFNDLSYFIKLFKKQTGISPVKYRDKLVHTIES